MITLLFVLLVLGGLFAAICTGCIALLDPIIAILVIWGVYKLIKKIRSKKK